MAEYVTKEQVIDWYRPYGHTDEPIPFETLVSDLRDMKAADVAPVRHGRWIDLGDDYWERGRTSTRYKCSECGRRAGQKQAKLYHYCPNCGAKMDGGADHEDD